MTTTTGYICKYCGQGKAYEEMAHLYKRARRYCRECDRARKRAETEAKREAKIPPPVRISSVDPCPACGVPQADHWKCRICTARGHILRRSTNDPEICADCESNSKAGRLSTAA